MTQIDLNETHKRIKKEVKAAHSLHVFLLSAVKTLGPFSSQIIQPACLQSQVIKRFFTVFKDLLCCDFTTLSTQPQRERLKTNWKNIYFLREKQTETGSQSEDRKQRGQQTLASVVLLVNNYLCVFLLQTL